MTTLANCSYEYDEALTIGESLVNVDFATRITYGIYACTPFKWEYAVNLLCVILCLIGFRWLYDGFMRVQRRGAATPFRLAEELTKRDNPALAIDFASFLFAMCFITRGSLSGLEPGINNGLYFGAFFTYQFVGVIVILVSRILNDKLMLRGTDNIKTMIEDKSVSVACVQAGTTISTALIFSAACGGGESTFGEGILLTLIYLAIGQVLLIAYTNIVDCITSLPLGERLVSGTDGAQGSSAGAATSLFKETSAGNTAAGLSVGLDLVHAGLLITAPINIGFGVLPWIIFVGTTLGVVSPTMHLYLDHIIMRGSAYSVSILRHKNWGAAVLVGSLKVLLALVLTSTYDRNCEPHTLYGPTPCTVKFADSFYARLGEVSIPDIFKWHSLTNLIVLLLLMLVTKFIYFLRFACKGGAANIRNFSLDAKLADRDNNAIAISLAAYTFSQGLVVVGVVLCPSDNPGLHAAETLLWTLIGGVLLLLAFAINDCLLLAKISNTEHLLENNVAIACFEGGSFVSCGIILRATLMGGGDYNYAEGLALTVVYWLVSQILLLVIAYLYRLITFFDDWEALKANNAAAGLSGGFTLVALAIIMAFPIPMYTSLIIFLPIALMAIVALMILRKVVDVFVLPGDKLDKEIAEDQNWGAVIIEGAVALGIAYVTNMYVPPPGAPWVSDDIPYWDVCE